MRALDEVPESEQILNPERAPAGSHRHEHIRLGHIGPTHRQRVLPAITIEEEHSIIRPGMTDREEHELPPTPRMERVRHPHSPTPTDGIRRS